MGAKWCKNLIVLILITSLLLTGCGVAKSNSELQTNSAEGKITVTDSIGRKVEVPQNVKRIGCLYVFSGYAVTMLGRGQDIVAVVNGIKRDKLITEISPNITEAATPVTSGKINIEELVKAKPDIVFIQGDTGRDEGEIEKLDKFKIPYIVVEFNNIKGQMEAIETIGKAIGKPEKARLFNEYYKQSIDRVKKVTEKIADDNKVTVYHSVNEATRTDTSQSLSAEWIGIAGGKYVSSNQELKLVEEKYFANLEQILLWNPEVIFVNEDGVSDYIIKNKQWASIRAVKENKVFQLPEGVSRWGHPGGLETPLAILWGAKTLYPDKFTDIDMRQETKDFYTKFFDFNLDENTISQILTGKGMRDPKS